jgi:hypothetical protein
MAPKLEQKYVVVVAMAVAAAVVAGIIEQNCIVFQRN